MKHFWAEFEKQANLFDKMKDLAGAGIAGTVSALKNPGKLPPVKRDPKIVAQADKTFKRLMNKAAASLYGVTKGFKALNRGNRAQSSMMARPTPMMATVGRTSSSPLPSAVAPKSQPHMHLPKQPAGTKLSPTSKGSVQKVDSAPGVAI